MQKLTEVGVDRIVPFAAERSVCGGTASGPSATSSASAGSPARRPCRARRSRLPAVAAPVPFSTVAGLPGAALADPGGTAPDLDRPRACSAGPRAAGRRDERADRARAVDLGPHVLRAETAAVAAGPCSSPSGHDWSPAPADDHSA